MTDSEISHQTTEVRGPIVRKPGDAAPVSLLRSVCGYFDRRRAAATPIHLIACFVAVDREAQRARRAAANGADDLVVDAGCAWREPLCYAG